MSLIGSALSDLLGTSGDSWKWQEHLHPASFRGVPFAVVTGEGVFGRRQAMHEYPYRDTAWSEDMGRATRRMTIRGFLVQSSQLYNAPDVMTQRDSLIAACEEAGPATLVHPTLGEMTVSITESGLRINEGAECGRVFEFTLTIIETGLRVFAITSSADAVSSVSTSWFGLASKTATGFIATVKGEIRAVNQTIKTLKNTAQFWVKMVNSTVNEATNLGNTLRSTFGSTRYGRFNFGSVGGSANGATGNRVQQPDAADFSGLVSQRLALAVTGRATITQASAAFINAASVEDYAIAAERLVSAIMTDAVSALDLIRIMETLSSENNDDVFYANSSDTRIAQAANHMMVVLCAGSMVYAASQFQPESYDEASALLARVCDVVDHAALAAADRGHDDEYRSLNDMRQSIVTLLQQAGANLSRLEIQRFNRSLPALNIANRLYQDASRSDGLVSMANPVHPAFMPTRFKALSS
ncbi:DNA circularization protein [Yersinia ruckeri]|uniref:DNA circularization protein n=1 Tax=Yersinia ruckeri TaxID=29486 RepID=UPI0011A8BF86|nr:DNA circularization N-terminal domain-containing protein [Yersinia ruckeri]